MTYQRAISAPLTDLWTRSLLVTIASCRLAITENPCWCVLDQSLPKDIQKKVLQIIMFKIHKMRSFYFIICDV